MEFKAKKSVFVSSSLLIFLVTGVGVISPEAAGSIFKSIQTWLIAKTSWLYVASVAGILFFSFWLMISRLGDIRLGPDDSAPEYSYGTWFAMLFSAGMGIGLLFFGVSEPLMHFAAPPVGEPFELATAQEAMKTTFFHWGLHAWAIYATFAVTLAYFCYRKSLPLLPRSVLFPFIGDRIYGPMGDALDVFAIFGTMFGVGTSLGIGVSQVNAGLAYLFGVEQSTTVQMILIGLITGVATISVVLGLDKGIRRLSNLNIVLAVSLLVIVMVLGNTIDLLQVYVQNTGAYLSDIVYKTFNLYAYERKKEWIGGWTLLYWGWWISWAPFVGMFIARISKGRTIREFMIGVLFLPTSFTFLWMTVFGNSAIWQTINDPDRGLSKIVDEDVSLTLFHFLQQFPGSDVLSGLALVLVITFFVSSSDSGSLVIDTLASGGVQEPPVWQRVYWASLEGIVAAILLLAGGLSALQTMTIASAFPLIFMIGLGCIGLVKTLREDHLLMTQVTSHNTAMHFERAATSWRERLDMLLEYPKKKKVEDFLVDVVNPAMSELCNELKAKGLEVKVHVKAGESVSLTINNDDQQDFSYGVRLQVTEAPSFAEGDQKKYSRAEVFLIQGGQDYDVYGYSKDQLIADAVTQYEKHLHFLHLSH